MINMEGKIFVYSWYSKIVDRDAIGAELQNILVRSGLHILDTVEHDFVPQGYTKIFLLAESHLAVHTFPEKGVSWIELASCSEEKFNSFVRLIADSFLFNKEFTTLRLEPNA